jgi:lipopolysaccharide transport protein LptA
MNLSLNFIQGNVMKKLLVLLSIFALNTYAARVYNDGQQAVLSADSVSEYDGQNEYSKNVVFTQGDLVINAANASSSRYGNIINFNGNQANFERGSVEGSARSITYYKSKQKLVLSGNPRIGAGDNEVVGGNGEVLVFNLANNSANIFEVETE